MALALAAAYNPAAAAFRSRTRLHLLGFALMRTASRFLGSALVLLSLGGCAWFQHPDFHLPNWRSPGPAYYQQYQAVRYDPYPKDDLGPEVIGGRPRGYQKPPPEVTRARQPLPWGNWRGQTP